uniref:Serpin domain-containing protein n=1 Tax=Parascaris univalens TaxID=6257 RepID=A0A915AG03_PARUN
MNSLPFVLSAITLLKSSMCISSIITAVDEAQVNFAISLLEFSSDANSSTVLSPFSVAIALAMLYAGSEGHTYDQMRQLLAKNSSDAALHDYFASFFNDESVDYELISSSKVYLKRDLKLRARFLEIIQVNYDGNLRQVDFSQPEAVAKEINDYVQQETDSKIRNLVNAGMFSEQSLIIILSAVYFKGRWKDPFVEKDTHKKYFRESEDKRRQVDMMVKTGGFPYFENDNVQILGLHYDDHEVTMYILLPKRIYGLVTFEQSLHGTLILELLHNCTWNIVRVELPKFQLEGEFELSNALYRMGLKDAFTNRANFSGISHSTLFISKVVHKSLIKVNENGTEAAAGTALTLFGDRLQKTRINFVADHPFLFAVLKHNTILFIGRFC